MTIKYFANRVQETSTSTGSGNLVLSGPPLGYRSFTASIGNNNKFTYYIYRLDTNAEWEIGVGYILSSGGVDQLVRERVLSSSSGGNFVGFGSGTKYVETILGEDRVNTSFVNLDTKSSSFTASYIPATYVVDASSSNVQINLPAVTTQNDPIVLGFLLNKTIGSQYEQINAIRLVPSGTETIAGTTGLSIGILNDYLQIASIPSQSGWVLLDPIQEATNPYGNDGVIQFKSSGAFSGVNQFVWDIATNKLLIGNSGVNTADIVLSSSSGNTTIFNQNLYDNDFRIAGTGNSHLLFVDGGLNRVGINTSAPTNALLVNAGSYSGITINKSGTGPSVTLYNTSSSGITTNNVVGSIVFNGLSSTNNTVRYGSLSNIIDSATNNAEYSSFSLDTLVNGAIENIAIFNPSGVTLGSNNQNFDGILLGAGSNNDGNNIVLGYYNNICGENCVVLGNNVVLASGTYGGGIGSNHSISGINTWIFGGSGLSTTGNNITLIGLDEDNYLQIKDSGNFKYVTLTNQDINFSIDNIAVLNSGIKQNIGFTFLNSSAVVRTGLLITSEIVDTTNLSERSTFVVKSLSTGSLSEIINIDTGKINIGNNINLGNNIIYGLNNKTNGGNEIIFGSGIVATGTNNVVIGHSSSFLSSGNNTTSIGNNNICGTSGTMGIVIVGNNNEINEDYAITVGTDNASSGIYAVSCGYLNGTHGDYSVGIGQGNTVQANYSVAIGRNNNLNVTDVNGSVFAMGVGNISNISNTGILVGYTNAIYGSGSTVVGNNCVVSGSQNVIIGNNINFSGNNTLLSSGTHVISYGNISGSLSSANDHRVIVTPNSTSLFGPSGILISGSPISITADAQDSITLTTSGLNITNNQNIITSLSSGITLSSNSGIIASGNSTLLYANTTGIVTSLNNHRIIVTPNLTSLLGPSGVSISGDNIGVTGLNNIRFYSDPSDYWNLSPTGTEIYGSGIKLIASNTSAIINSGLISFSGANIDIFGNNISNGTLNIYPANTRFVSGVVGFGVNSPSYTVDISGSCRITNTGVGIIYSGYPIATGTGIPLVIENNIVKAMQSPYVGVRVSSISGSLTLTSADKQTQLLNPILSSNNLTINPTGMVEGKQFFIRNISTTLNSNHIDVIDGFTSSGLCTLGGSSNSDKASCMVVFDGTRWRLVMIGQ